MASGSKQEVDELHRVHPQLEQAGERGSPARRARTTRRAQRSASPPHKEQCVVPSRRAQLSARPRASKRRETPHGGDAPPTGPSPPPRRRKPMACAKSAGPLRQAQRSGATFPSAPTYTAMTSSDNETLDLRNGRESARVHRERRDEVRAAAKTHMASTAKSLPDATLFLTSSACAMKSMTPRQQCHYRHRTLFAR